MLPHTNPPEDTHHQYNLTQYGPEGEEEQRMA